MQKITTHLWFDKEAKEAAKFYTSTFKDSRITSTSVLHNTPSGSVDILTIELAKSGFTLLSAGPLFKFNPSISFLVSCATTAETETLWKKLSRGGKALMEFGAYPFSELYGWTEDTYGLSWQVMLVGDRPIRQKITPSLMYTGAVAGKAEEAINFYTSLFHDSGIDHIMRYEGNEGPDKAGTVQHAGFRLAGLEFGAMDSAHEHKFAFNEAISFLVHCESQEEIDHYWDKMSADPSAEQCGWLKDKYGVSWQIVPTGMDEFLSGDDSAKVARVTEAFLKMKKIDMAALEAAAKGVREHAR